MEITLLFYMDVIINKRVDRRLRNLEYYWVVNVVPQMQWEG